MAILFHEPDEILSRLAAQSPAHFPGPMATELTEKYHVERGQIIGLMLTKLKEKWMDANYTESVDEIAKFIPKCYEEFRIEGIVDENNKFIKRGRTDQKGPGVKKIKQKRKN